ncbi:Lrp/AsnC family transcriptional regulator [Desulfovibrio inopinatus]|uniref:Lrp/AsnC family transcriptional regulator n=1 Tax=Desulfovibrio inopinatus TaxID=102109 RepID=UPI0003FE801B|nr:Lrp/AsnC family transcriptional regulator [Desulfovibrio inopinatus]
MNKIQLDHHDADLLRLLAEDGQTTPAKLSEHLSVTAPTVRSRIKNLMQKGVLRIAGLLDPAAVRGVTIALVGLTLSKHGFLGEKLDQITQLPNVNWAVVVTGRYDIIVEVVLSDDTADLYRFLDEALPRIGDIASSESFVVMRSRRKWVLLPEAFAVSQQKTP